MTRRANTSARWAAAAIVLLLLAACAGDQPTALSGVDAAIWRSGGVTMAHNRFDGTDVEVPLTDLGFWLGADVANAAQQTAGLAPLMVAEYAWTGTATDVDLSAELHADGALVVSVSGRLGWRGGGPVLLHPDWRQSDAPPEMDFAATVPAEELRRIIDDLADSLGDGEPAPVEAAGCATGFAWERRNRETVCVPTHDLSFWFSAEAIAAMNEAGLPALVAVDERPYFAGSVRLTWYFTFEDREDQVERDTAWLITGGHAATVEGILAICDGEPVLQAHGLDLDCPPQGPIPQFVDSPAGRQLAEVIGHLYPTE
ncbi:MAG: hypothetical protein FWG11_06230 [Promicromonosporaceae bacterium]|nr:hypothetical protein [Promicromonosporaceae bacterium]